MIAIRKIELPIPGIERLQQEACDEGYDFIETLVEEWASATNRFRGPGEILCGYVDQGLFPSKARMPVICCHSINKPAEWQL
jgi:hypothetical protein